MSDPIPLSLPRSRSASFKRYGRFKQTQLTFEHGIKSRVILDQLTSSTSIRPPPDTPGPQPIRKRPPLPRDGHSALSRNKRPVSPSSKPSNKPTNPDCELCAGKGQSKTADRIVGRVASRSLSKIDAGDYRRKDVS